MTVNCSHLPIFPPLVPDDSLVHQEKDIHDILPVDPFGMNLGIDPTAIKLLGDLADYGWCGGYEGGFGEAHSPDYLGLNFWRNTLGDFQPNLGQRRTFTAFNRVFSSDRVDGFVPDKAFNRFVDNGSISYGCCTLGDVVVGCGHPCADGCVNVLRRNNTYDRLGKFVTKEALGQFFGEPGVHHGFETMNSDFCGSGNSSSSVYADNSIGDVVDLALALWGVHNNSNDRFGGFVTEEEVGNGIGDRSVKHGCEARKNDIFGYGNARGSVNVLSRNVADDRFGEFVTKEALGNFFVEHGIFECGSTSNCSSVPLDKYCDVDEDPLRTGFNLAFGFLGIRDLLLVQSVCKSFRNTVQTDPLLWRSIEIDHPINTRITDDALLQLTNRAQGSLECLSLVECNRITSDGLMRVLDSNPKLSKLSVPGCTNIKIEGIINLVRAFQLKALELKDVPEFKDVSGIKCLRVHGRSVTCEQFEELRLLLGSVNHVQSNSQKPRFFLRRNIDLSWEDDRPIDLEICPKCKLVKLVYDCTAESCQVKDQMTHHCRACLQCIRRCILCGKCTHRRPYVEDFFLDNVCTDCLDKKSKCQDG